MNLLNFVKEFPDEWSCRKRFITGIIFLLLLSVTAESQLKQTWQLVWEENFDGVSLDTSRWSKIPRGGSDWDNIMSDYDGCYEVSGGQLILRGIRNTVLPEDT
ncbi:MAG: hypothetical protein LBN11_08145, partial [Tannerella sp.]|nr:hypothetical protein [Tannerella sp.]